MAAVSIINFETAPAGERWRDGVVTVLGVGLLFGRLLKIKSPYSRACISFFNSSSGFNRLSLALCWPVSSEESLTRLTLFKHHAKKKKLSTHDDKLLALSVR